MVSLNLTYGSFTCGESSIFQMKTMIHYFIFITFLIVPTTTRDCSGPLSNEAKVFITISSLASTSVRDNVVTQRQIELNWFNITPQEGDWVGLFKEDPNINKTQPVVKISPLDYPYNYSRTSIEFPRFNFSLFNLQNQCVGFWIAFIRDDVIISQNCARIQPQWMWDSRETIGRFNLSQLMIPGTHDTGSYSFYEGIKSEDIINRMAMCQDEDVMTQLIYGIRAFDLRLFSDPEEDDEFWLTHDFIRMRPFKIAINDFKYFIQTTKEIIILDFHRFPVGFDNDTVHHRLITYVIDELGQWMAPSRSDVTLDELWKSNKRIVVAYNDPIQEKYDSLWPGISQKWANTEDVGALKKYFTKVVEKLPSGLWAAQAELTSQSVLSKGLRVFADMVNRNVTRWFRDKWWDKANIVNTDYFHGNDIIDVAIRANFKRACKRESDDTVGSRSCGFIGSYTFVGFSLIFFFVVSW